MNRQAGKLALLSFGSASYVSTSVFGCTIEEIFNLTKIDRWFLVQIKEIVDFEEELATAKN